jgi:WD40 repeat protein
VLPKDKLDALLADPKALADLLRGHIVEGYFPSGTMSSTPGVPGFNRTVRNLRGEQLTLTGDDEGLSVNGVMTGPTQPIFVANGTRIMPFGKLLLPEPTGTAAVSPAATASDVPSSSAEIILTGHTSRVSQASFAPDGKTVVTSSDDRTARLWDAATGKELHRFIGHTDEVRTVAFSPDGNYILTASHDGTARLWRVD